MAALDSCSVAVTSVPWDPGRRIVFHAIAVFPAGSSPRLKVLSFGIDYDPTKFVMAARGTCADFEIPGVGWLAPGTGTSQSWTTGTRTALLTECYWFAGYAYSEQDGEDSTSVALIPHPVQHGVFVDDAFPSVVDTIAGYGRMGFGPAGYLPCPNTGSEPPGDDGMTPDGSSAGSDPDNPEPPDGDLPPREPVYDPVECTARLLNGWNNQAIPGVTIQFKERYYRSHCQNPCNACTTEFPTRSGLGITDQTGTAHFTFQYEECHACSPGPYCREGPTAEVDAYSAFPDLTAQEGPLNDLFVYQVLRQGATNFVIYLMPDSLVAARFAPVIHSHSYENQSALGDVDVACQEYGTLKVFRLQEIYSGTLGTWHRYSTSQAWDTFGQPSNYAHTTMQIDLAGNTPGGAPVGERPLYFHVFQLSETELVVQYWLWLNRNTLGDWSVDTVGDHEGDWEYVSIKVGYFDGELQPEAVNMGRHNCRKTFAAAACWWGTNRDGTYYDMCQGWAPNREHLHVWMAARSHALYNRYDPVYTFELSGVSTTFWDRVDYNIADKPAGAHLYHRYDRLVDMGEVWDLADVYEHGLTWDVMRMGSKRDFMRYLGQFGADDGSPRLPVDDQWPHEWREFHEAPDGDCGPHGADHIHSDFLIPAENDSAPLGVSGQFIDQPRMGFRVVESELI
jgi:hypothetical protein